ncbi:MAG: voltage-gated potassium channel [Gammaproteobacteria bacterium]|nr:MAG: voltage-gated potassium channel [Gammaproteobacteria bacterium]
MKKIIPPQKIKSYSIDEFGVKNYNTFYLLIITLIVLYAIIALLAYPLVHFEATAENANITTYRDAFWALQMSASTIGFGDFYPVTQAGRIIIALMFYIGVGMVGFIGAQFVNKFVGFSDTNIKNRELRYQNAQILKSNQRLEKKVESLLKHFEILIQDEDKLLDKSQQKSEK